MVSTNDVRNDEMKSNGTFNNRAANVSATIFMDNPFSNPCDLMQVKYEMLRSVEKDGLDVTVAAKSFGFSRVSFYQIKKEFEANGIVGLMPQKRGPHGSRKITDDDVDFAWELEGTLTKDQIVKRLLEERGVDISKRTLERKFEDKKTPLIGEIPANNKHLTEKYEALRSFAISPVKNPLQPLGLDLWLKKGFFTWCEVIFCSDTRDFNNPKNVETAIVEHSECIDKVQSGGLINIQEIFTSTIPQELVSILTNIILQWRDTHGRHVYG